MNNAIDLFLSEKLSNNSNMVFYSGLVNKEIYNKIWKTKNFVKGKLTNVSIDFNEALGFSWDDSSVVKISNVPLEAIVGVRKDNYTDDEDYTPLSDNISRIHELKNSSMFVLDLFLYRNIIKTELIEDAPTDSNEVA
jgi:hypothetical protein